MYLVAPEGLSLGVYNALAAQAPWVHSNGGSAVEVQTVLLGQEEDDSVATRARANVKNQFWKHTSIDHTAPAGEQFTQQATKAVNFFVPVIVPKCTPRPGGVF